MKNPYKMHDHMEFTCKRDITLADPQVVSGTNTFRENVCCKYFLFFISFIFMQINSNLIPVSEGISDLRSSTVNYSTY